MRFGSLILVCALGASSISSGLCSFPSEEVIRCRVDGLQALLVAKDFKSAELNFKNGLELDPDDYSCNLYLGMGYMEMAKPPNFGAAKDCLARAVSVEASAFNTLLLGQAAHLAGDSSLAQSCTLAIPGLLRAGKDKDVPFRAPDLKWGREQLRAMLAHCPAMKSYIKPGGWLESFAIAKLGGDGLNTRILFSDESPVGGKFAVTFGDVNWAADMKLNMYTPVGVAYQRLGELQWNAFIFEMLNDDWRERDYWILVRAAGRGLSIQAIGAQYRAIEAGTDRKVVDFYFDHWKPYCEANAFPSDPSIWCPRNVFPEEAEFKIFAGFDRAYEQLYPAQGK